MIIVTLGIGWFIWALVIVRRGQTPAKSLLGLRGIDDGEFERLEVSPRDVEL